MEFKERENKLNEQNNRQYNLNFFCKYFVLKVCMYMPIIKKRNKQLRNSRNKISLKTQTLYRPAFEEKSATLITKRTILII